MSCRKQWSAIGSKRFINTERSDQIVTKASCLLLGMQQSGILCSDYPEAKDEARGRSIQCVNWQILMDNQQQREV